MDLKTFVLPFWESQQNESEILSGVELAHSNSISELTLVIMSNDLLSNHPSAEGFKCFGGVISYKILSKSINSSCSLCGIIVVGTH